MTTDSAPSRDRSRCLFCGGRLDARVSCPRCDREAPALDAKRARELSVTCPRCFIALELASQADDAEFLYCIGCHGCFVPPQDWAELVARAEARADEEDAPLTLAELKALPPEQGPTFGARSPEVACPVCRVDMARVKFPHTDEDIDVCSAHGIWFDAAELTRVLRKSTRPEKDDGAPADRRTKQRSAIAAFARFLAGG